MGEFLNELKIPQGRVAVLIGADGATKQLVEKATNSTIAVESKEGEVHISGDDPLQMFICAEIVKAIGRGFNPETALLLTKIDFVLEIISVNEFAKTPNDFMRLRGRVIGKDGRMRRVIEELLEVNLCVYGKTIGIIGRGDSVSLARRAVESLLGGSPHTNVYHWLEKQRSMYKRRAQGEKDLKEEL